MLGFSQFIAVFITLNYGYIKQGIPGLKVPQMSFAFHSPSIMYFSMIYLEHILDSQCLENMVY